VDLFPLTGAGLRSASIPPPPTKVLPNKIINNLVKSLFNDSTNTIRRTFPVSTLRLDELQRPARDIGGSDQRFTNFTSCWKPEIKE